MPNDRPRKRDSARLVWDSKPRRAPNPRDIEFQTAEIVIPNPQRDLQQLPFGFGGDPIKSEKGQLALQSDGTAGWASDPRDQGILRARDIEKTRMNRLIWGDNLLAMQALLSQGYEGKFDLIYIDPPFDSKADYSYPLLVGKEEITKEPSVVERLAYKDTWVGGTDSYLDMLYPRLQLIKRLMSEKGSLFVHLDWHVGHYAKVLLDEVFGRDHFTNEIVWYYYNKFEGNIKYFARNHDVIFWYRKGENWTFEPQNELREKPISQLKRVWDKEKGKIVNVKDAEGKVVYRESTHRRIDDVWRISMLQPADKTENMRFPTQKPEALIERLILACSEKNDLVADFFSGSGTLPAVAERCQRRWLACELGKVGVQLTRARLVANDAKPFLIENIGNYQREMIYLTGTRIHEMMAIVLKLYGASPRPGTPELGTRKAQDDVTELVYVGYPDRPTTAKKVEELARMAERLDGTGYKRLVVLAWDYDYNFSSELDKRFQTGGQRIRTKVESRTIPPEIYEYLKKAKDDAEIESLRGKIRFHEKPYLKLGKPAIEKKGQNLHRAKVKIERYVLFDIPVEEEEDREKLRQIAKDNFAVLIDYWAVDWDYDGTTFRSQWQDLRGNGKNMKIVTTHAETEFQENRKYTIAVRLVDIFGNDAAETIVVDLR
jgi:adenine-specific DNA-methyltransferase